MKLFGQIFSPVFEYRNAIRSAKKAEYCLVLRQSKYQIQILLFGLTILTVLEYRIICPPLLTFWAASTLCTLHKLRLLPEVPYLPFCRTFLACWTLSYSLSSFPHSSTASPLSVWTLLYTLTPHNTLSIYTFLNPFDRLLTKFFLLLADFQKEKNPLKRNFSTD